MGRHPRVDLAVADIEGNDAGRAVLQQTVGKSPRRGAHIEAVETSDIERKGGESSFELLAPAADKAGPRRALERGIHGIEVSRLGGRMAAHADLTSQDQPPRLFPAFGQLPPDHKLIQPLPFHGDFR